MAILEAIGLIGGSGYGLIGLLKWLRGRKPTSVQIVDNQYIFEVIESNFSETFAVDFITGKLYQSRLVRKELALVVKPLERDGIHLFASGKDGKTSEVIEKDDTPCFEFTESEEIISDIILENILLQIESAAFKEQNKWRFNDGTCSFFGEIADSEFIQEINNGKERFGKGDVLHVDLRRTQIISEKIKKIAICGGSGSFLIQDAIRAKADVFITSDIKYHDFFEANNQLVLVDIGHFESEQFTIELFADVLKNNFPTFAHFKTDVHTNPVKYL